MGFPWVAMTVNMPKCINITGVLQNLLGYFKFMVTVALTHLGLLEPPQQAYSSEVPTSYVFVMDGLCPSLLPVPVHILTALIKKRLPVVEYSDFLERNGVDQDEDTVCTVCLNCIERGHEIRELSNCSHVFHRECLDSWVDEGQVTCPLCRSMLFPTTGGRTRCGGDPWMMQMNP